MKTVVLLCVVFLCSIAVGMTITANAQADKNKSPDNTITFSKNVAPIFYGKCVECHRPGEMAPMSLLSYKDARPWAKSIKEKVISREMPPWYADEHYGEFSNERRLTKQEIDTITAWVDQGAIQGAEADLPAQPVFSKGWQIGKPDLVLTMPNEMVMPAGGDDQYTYYRIPTNFKEDMWVQALEIHPGNKKIVHHVIAYIETPQLIDIARSIADRESSKVDESKMLSVFEAGSSFFEIDGSVKRLKKDWPVYDDACEQTDKGAEGIMLGEYGPGKDIDAWPEGMAKKIPAGSNIIFNVHYSNNTGNSEKDRSELGLVFSKTPVRKQVITRETSNYFFKILPGVENYEVKTCYTFPEDVQFINYLPHMHLRGKDMKYEAVYPDGRRETLLSVRYNFNWQMMYKLKKPLAIPKGTKIIFTAHFDNSAKNKYNPDPTKVVRFGGATSDEMMSGLLDYIIDKPRP